jgi:hemerythrin-like metal-binding protein
VESPSSELFCWTSKYSVGIPDIDEQHQKLVGMVNALYKAMRNGQGQAILSPLFEALVTYTEQHFSYEENLMRRSGYAMIAAHIEEHRALTRKARELREKFLAGRLTITLEVMTFLKEWLQKHILGSDAVFARTVSKKNGPYPAATRIA